MAHRGAQPGNRNGAKDKPWEAALRRIAAQDPERVRRVAEKVFELAEAGDMQAAKELFDRLDGKVKQQTELTGAEGAALIPAVIQVAPPQ